MERILNRAALRRGLGLPTRKRMYGPQATRHISATVPEALFQEAMLYEEAFEEARTSYQPSITRMIYCAMKAYVALSRCAQREEFWRWLELPDPRDIDMVDIDDVAAGHAMREGVAVYFAWGSQVEQVAMGVLPGPPRSPAPDGERF